MEKLIIPKGCVIQGDITAISNEGDIEINGDLIPSSLNSGKGNIRLTSGKEETRLEKIMAQNGRVDITAGKLKVSQISAKSVNLKTSDLSIGSSIKATDDLVIEAAGADIPRCQGNRVQVKVHSLNSEKIEASGELVIRAARLQVHTIQARKVVLQGNIDCKQVHAEEGVVVESGHISIKSLESPKFHAAAEVTGIVMVSNCVDVRAQGVRGFIHPSELEMLSKGQDPVSVPTVMLSAAADDWTTQEPPEEEDVIITPPSDEPILETAEPPEIVTQDEIATEELSDDEILEVDDSEPEPDFSASAPIEPFPVSQPIGAPASLPVEEAASSPAEKVSPLPAEEAASSSVHEVSPLPVEEPPPPTPVPGPLEIIEPPTEELEPEELEDLASDDSLEDSDFDDSDLEDTDEDLLDSISPEEAPAFEEEEHDDELDDPLRAIEALDLGDMEPDESLQMPTDIFDHELGESVYGFDLDKIGKVSDAEEAEEISAEDLQAVEDEITGDLSEESMDFPAMDPEEELAQDLAVIIAQIRDFFSEDNYPNSINQIQRFIEERRFNLFAKPRNQEAVLANFDKYDHKEISRLARTFFERLDQYYRSLP